MKNKEINEKAVSTSFTTTTNATKGKTIVTLKNKKGHL